MRLKAEVDEIMHAKGAGEGEMVGEGAWRKVEKKEEEEEQEEKEERW